MCPMARDVVLCCTLTGACQRCLIEAGNMNTVARTHICVVIARITWSGTGKHHLFEFWPDHKQRDDSKGRGMFLPNPEDS